MTRDEHKKRHRDLYIAFDELLTDFIWHTDARPDQTTVMDFFQWSYAQILDPTEPQTGGQAQADAA